MRGTNTVTELVDIKVSAIALVGKPALGKPYAIIKSEEVPGGLNRDDSPSDLLEVVRAMKAEIDLLKSSIPLPSSDKPFVEAPPDPQRDVMLKSLKNLVAGSSELLKEQREQLAVIAKYHGLEGPPVGDDEDPKISPAMQSLMQKMDVVATAINGLVAQISSDRSPASPPVKKADDQRLPEDFSAIEKAMAVQRETRRELELLQWNLVRAMGKDPGPKPQ